LLRRFALFYSNNIAHNHKVSGRNLAATINQGEFKLLAFTQTFKACALNRADVNEHVFAAVFTLDKAEALAAIEEFDHAAALADDLRGHSAAAAATAEATATATAAAEATAAAAAAAAAAEAITAAAAEAITAAAETIAATAKAITAAASERIETVSSETIPLVPAPAAPSSVKTHKT